MCFPSISSAAGTSQPQTTMGELVGVKLDSLTHNGQRLLKLPSASKFQNIQGVSIGAPPAIKPIS